MSLSSFSFCVRTLCSESSVVKAFIACSFLVSQEKSSIKAVTMAMNDANAKRIFFIGGWY